MLIEIEAELLKAQAQLMDILAGNVPDVPLSCSDFADSILAKFKAHVTAVKNPYTPSPTTVYGENAYFHGFESCRGAIIKELEG